MLGIQVDKYAAVCEFGILEFGTWNMD